MTRLNFTRLGLTLAIAAVITPAAESQSERSGVPGLCAADRADHDRPADSVDAPAVRERDKARLEAMKAQAIAGHVVPPQEQACAASVLQHGEAAPPTVEDKKLQWEMNHRR